MTSRSRKADSSAATARTRPAWTPSSLKALPAAIRTRVLRDAAIMAGCPHGALTAGHVERIEELVTGWRGQRWVDLPGGVRARRRDGKVWFTSTEAGNPRGGEE